MPPINGAAATVGVIAISVAAAAAVAIYESPELQRFTNDLRRRIAIALHAFGDSITPQERQNLFNRPEDAEGFLQSHGLGPGSVPDFEADAESLRRQREELMYWNAIRESKESKEHDDEKRQYRQRSSTGTSFDDFLKQDESAEKGTYVYQTGHDALDGEGLIRRRHRSDGSRGMNHSIYTDPFADEHGIEDDIAFENSLMEPGKDEVASDIYSATDLGAYQPSRTLSPQPKLEGIANTLAEMDIEKKPDTTPATPTARSELQPQSRSQPPSESELGADEYMTAGQDDRNSHDAYSSIQAWATHASLDASFYSPLPESPAAPASEAELISDGELTPTDSMSLAGSGVDVADEMRSVGARSFDVLSEDDDGMHTPSSWTDVESAAGESEFGAVRAN
ncbi:hypothetical protein F5B22DRAFT_644636 [Xylaria bambusicola]|uniref:uncharacterized protein n=1 Tax=Xylaria bambusicola TaxID=326684 RepID=UPI002007CDF9|nr:uncharacterized protein F5B22DRAFT_644636 [Xylaria bambusicola]KAI0520895.1 hypothetical protein F5B22DRAFT_644636 [Xylaria bambusicola]